MSSHPQPRVLVTFAADEERRAVIDDVLGDVAAVVYLDDVAGEERGAEVARAAETVHPVGSARVTGTAPVARAAEIARADVLFSWVPGEELRDDEWSQLSHVRLVQVLSAGVEHVPFELLPRGLPVAGNVGGYAEPMAEHILAMILALAKRLCFEHGELRRGVFNQDTLNRELRDKTCAILGLGGVGRATLPLVRALGMRVVAINSSGHTDETVDFIGTLDDLEGVLRDADVVVLSLPLTRRTRDLIGARELGCMRPDAILINVARGPIVDEEALYRHLFDHPGFSAGLEVWWDEPFADGRLRVRHPFLELPNVLGCPHNSGIVPGWLDVGVRRAAENVRRFVLGQAVVGLAEHDDYLG